MTPQPGLAEPETKATDGASGQGAAGFTFGGLAPGIGFAAAQLDATVQEEQVESHAPPASTSGFGFTFGLAAPGETDAGAQESVSRIEPKSVNEAPPTFGVQLEDQTEESSGFSFGLAARGEIKAALPDEPSDVLEASVGSVPPVFGAQPEAETSSGGANFSLGGGDVQSSAIVVLDTLSSSSGAFAYTPTSSANVSLEAKEEIATPFQSHPNSFVQLLTPKKTPAGEKLEGADEVAQPNMGRPAAPAAAPAAAAPVKIPPVVGTPEVKLAETSAVARSKRTPSKAPGPWLNDFKSLPLRRRKELKTDFKYLMNVWMRLTADKRRHLVRTALHMWGSFHKMFASRKNSTSMKRLLPSQSELDLLRNIALRLHTQERNQIGALLLETAYRAGALLKFMPDWCLDAECFQGLFAAAGEGGKN
jgi:hypothetical protein